MLGVERLRQYKIGVAGIIIQFIADDDIDLSVSGEFRSFLVEEGEPDFRLKVHFGPLPSLRLEEKLFDSGSIWSLYRSNGLYEITLSSESDAGEPVVNQAVVIDSGFKSGDLYVAPFHDTRENRDPAQARRDFLTYIADMIHPMLMMNLLPRGKGVEFHACGVNHKGHGVIFTGSSGSGKSTLARLWRDEKGASVLSDERIIVRQTDGRFRMYGTPWQSDAGISSPGSVPLERIFFINHGLKNFTSPLKAGDAASRLFVRCFPAFWDGSGLGFTLDFVGQIAEQIPCCELGFVPDRSVLAFVDEIIDSGEPSH